MPQYDETEAEGVSVSDVDYFVAQLAGARTVIEELMRGLAPRADSNRTLSAIQEAKVWLEGTVR